MGFPVETKHCGGFEPLDTIVARYQPQLQWQMLVTGARKAALSVIMGAKEPTIVYVDFDEAYAKELWERACAFMLCVQTLTPPVALSPVAPPVKAEKTYDMNGNNAWAAAAATWLTTRQAYKDNEAATKEIKSIVPADAVRCAGYGLMVNRSKSGSILIKEA